MRTIQISVIVRDNDADEAKQLMLDSLHMDYCKVNCYDYESSPSEADAFANVFEYTDSED